MSASQNSKDPWQRLVAAARQPSPPSDENAPFGFATRVAALGNATPHVRSSLFERFALRAVGVAALLALGSVAFNLNTTPAPRTANPDSTAEVGGEDALSALVNA
jgi:hypothetical protein